MAKYDIKDFDEFRSRAKDSKLTNNEKSGFPEDFRKNVSQHILRDWEGKIPTLADEGRNILDIGPGCSELPHAFISYCQEKAHNLTLVDSAEMLDHLPSTSTIEKIPGRFPDALGTESQRQFDIIIAYSVLQYVFKAGNLYHFVDSALDLLKEGGYLLLGDLPNATRRKRFLSSSAGIRHHQQNYDPNTLPKVQFNSMDRGELDDGVILGLMARIRLSGFDSFIVPQSPELPMANRREDMLIYRP